MFFMTTSYAFRPAIVKNIVVGMNDPDSKNDQWFLKRAKAGRRYSIQNMEFDGFLWVETDPQETNEIIVRSGKEKTWWEIKMQSPGKYWIHPVGSSHLSWSLSSAHDGTPIKLQKANTDERCLWEILALQSEIPTTSDSNMMLSSQDRDLHKAPRPKSPLSDMATYSDTPRDWPSSDDAHGPKRSPQPILVPKEIPSFFALVIGIDKYATEDLKDLKGAVKDAKSITSYLINNLAVPESNIITLHDEKATRLAIIQGFDMLAAQGNGINWGDPILIHFSGHGGIPRKPETLEDGEWTTKAIIPHDYGLKNPSDGRLVDVILDRTINTQLEQLARVKGDNITMILDCCYIGPGSKSLSPTPQIESDDQTQSVSEGIYPDLDKYIWEDHATTAARRVFELSDHTLYSGLKSHVLIAACSEKEITAENEGGGVFTQALIEELVATKGNISYCDIIFRIPNLDGQTPRCEGLNKNRILWNSKARDTGLCFFDVEMNKGEYKLNAGMADAITDEAEFAIYQTMDDYNTRSSLGTLVVHSTKTFTSTLVPKSAQDASMDLQGPALALQIKEGIKEGLWLHVADPALARMVYAELRAVQSIANQRGISLGEHTARLSVTTEQGFIVFEIRDSLVTSWGLTRMPFRIKPRWFGQVIERAAHFYWHLRRGTESIVEQNTLQRAVQLEFTKVTIKHGRPTAVGDNLNIDDHIDLVVDQDTYYGVKLVNKSHLPLYPYLFFFDYSNLSIIVYYDPPTARQSINSAPLQPKSEMTIGYGDGMWPPWKYRLRDSKSIVPNEIEQDKQDISIGFLKLFLSTNPIKRLDIGQETPFAFKFKPGSRGAAPFKRKEELWGARLFAVVQRRVPPHQCR